MWFSGTHDTRFTLQILIPFRNEVCLTNAPTPRTSANLLIKPSDVNPEPGPELLPSISKAASNR